MLVDWYRFAEDRAVVEAWSSFTLASSAVILICTLVFCFGSRKTWFEVRLRSGIFASLLLSAITATISHRLYFSEFTAMMVKGDAILLHFPEQSKEVITISRSKIVNVLYAPSGRNYRGCYLRFELRNGDSFRSISKSISDRECKQLRHDMNTLIFSRS